MKIMKPYWSLTTCLAAAALTWLGSVTTGSAAGPALNGSLSLRPLTPTEAATYGLTGLNGQLSGGITTIGIGEPAYLEAMVNTAVTNGNITNIVWTLNSQPDGSLAVLQPSPLGTNVPVYKSADRSVYRAADRRLLRPDAVGTYVVGVSIQTRDSGTTNLSLRITGATYLGVQTCAACHSGAFAGVPDIYHTYTNTAHATAFKDAINGVSTDHFSKNCISCHVVGFDTNSLAVNNGFDDMATLLNWQFPATVSTNNWTVLPTQLKNLANVQCENCHGPGSQHQFSDGITGNTNAISITLAAQDCNQCHDSLTHHYRAQEWSISLHANSSRTPSGPSRAQCVRCHTAGGFVGWAEAGGMDALNANPTTVIPATPDTTYEALTCQTCHDPHDATNPHQLRLGKTVTLSDGTYVTNAGSGAFCMQCHNSRNGSVTNMMAKYPLNQANWAGGVGFGTHDSPQGDMLEGVNAVTYGKVIPSSPHANVVTNTCAGCHMQNVASTDAAFLKAGGHTFKMSYLTTNGSVVTKVPLTTVCSQCHGNLSSFNFQVADYNGDGVIEGVQTEVQHLMDKLSTLMPPSGYQANPNNYVADGKVKTSLSTYTNMPAKFLNAAYNFQFVGMDGSLGVHNAAFAVGLLKASIADLSGDANSDGLPDSWQVTYFGANFATNALAGPNAVNNAAGVPNWLMCTLGLNPRGAFTVTNSGVIYLNNNNIVNGATNTIAIYNAAEIAFDTQVGVSYQIQGVSAITGTWQNVSTNIIGTGGSVSYLTPTRPNLQMFYRVVHTP